MYVGDETLGAVRAGGGSARAPMRPSAPPRGAAPRATGGGSLFAALQKRVASSSPASGPRGMGGAFASAVQRLGPTSPAPGSIGGAVGQVFARGLRPPGASDASGSRPAAPRVGPSVAPFVMRMSDQSLAGYDGDVLQGLSLKGIVKGISNAGKAIGKAATQVGHAVGSVVTSKVGQAIEGGALALTGVGLPAAAGIMAATKGVGNLIKPGGNLSHALTGAAQGAAEGVVASAAGTLGRDVINKFRGGSTPSTAANVAQTVATNNLPGLSTVAALPAALTPSAVTSVLPSAVTAALTPPAVLRRQGSGSTAVYGTARALLRGGQAANSVASGAASDAASLAQKALDVAAAAQAASQLGNQAGASQLAQLAQQISTAAQNVAGGAGTAGVDLSALGMAAQGAAGGAVAGGAVGGISQFISDHKGLVIGTLAGAAVLMAVIFTPRSSSARARTA